jgi:hypothetical protein
LHQWRRDEFQAGLNAAPAFAELAAKGLVMNAPVSSESFRSAHRPAGHPDVRSGHIGVLLVNLGTPEATDYWSVR